MKVLLGFDERKIGTIAVSPAGQFVFEAARPDPDEAEADLRTLRQAAESYAHQLAMDDSIAPEAIESLTAGDVLKRLLDRMEAKRFWAEPADEEAAAACGRPVDWESAQAAGPADAAGAVPSVPPA